VPKLGKVTSSTPWFLAPLVRGDTGQALRQSFEGGASYSVPDLEYTAGNALGHGFSPLHFATETFELALKGDAVHLRAEYLCCGHLRMPVQARNQIRRFHGEARSSLSIARDVYAAMTGA
jgi:hypothetical protein